MLRFCWKYSLKAMVGKTISHYKIIEKIGATGDEETVEKVGSKIADYLNNLYPLPAPIDSEIQIAKICPRSIRPAKKVSPLLEPNH